MAKKCKHNIKRHLILKVSDNFLIINILIRVKTIYKQIQNKEEHNIIHGEESQRMLEFKNIVCATYNL